MDLSQIALNFAFKPFIVKASVQTGGRGQYCRNWFSPKGGLWMTQVFDVNNPAGLSTFISIPILRILKRYSSQVYVKWPNDILVNGKKIAGILTKKKGKTAFIGIGINVQNEIPEEMKEIATSLSAISKATTSSIWQELIECEESIITQFIENGFAPFKQEYEENLIFLNKTVEINSKQKYLGKAIGISEIGEIIIQTDDGIVNISSGTVLKF
jgi:BirA family biotin operon repressor/biotin-[acetyl-CoA-carboxylase] ligase